MRKHHLRTTMFAAAAGLLAAACSEGGITPPDGGTRELPAQETRSIAAPNVSSMRSAGLNMAMCGPGATYTLTNGRVAIGTVTVNNDAANVYVTYAVTRKDHFISDTRLAAARTYAGIPQDSRKMPLPWSFPSIGEHEPVVTSVSYTLPLSSLGVAFGDQMVIAAMAGVVYPTTGKYEGPWEWTAAWGIGNVAGNSVETIHNYVVAGCPNAPPPPPSSTGAFTITFDDGWEDTYTNAYPVLRDLGMLGNVAVNPDAVDQQWSTYMSLAQLRALDQAGWDIVSHSLSHRDLTTLTDAELQRELRDSKAWIQRNGFGPTDVFIVPFHSWGERELAAIRQHYAKARGYSANQFVPARYTQLPVTSSRYEIFGYEPEYAPFTTAEGREQTVALVEHAVRNGKHVDVFFHHITSSQVPAFRTLMQQLSQFKSGLRTWSTL